MRSIPRSVTYGVIGLSVLALAACSSNNNNGNNNKSNAPVATQAATLAATQAATRAASPPATRAASPAPSAAAASPATGAGSPAAATVPACPPSGSATGLTGAGSSFDNPLFSAKFDAYNQQCKVQVNYQSVGSGAGIQQLTAKTVQFGASDAPMTDEQIASAGGDILHIPVTIGAVPVGYNLPGVKAGVKMTGDVLAKIFLGTIKKWNDPALTALNPGTNLPNLDISIVHRSDGSGTSFIFTSYLSAVSPDWKAKVGAGTSVEWPTGAGGKGSEGVAALVTQTPGGIGYFELAYATQNNISTATLQNKNGKFVDPTSAGASAAAAGAVANLPPDLRSVFVDAPGDASYPISGFSWVVINTSQSDPKVAATLVYMLAWLTTTGQQGVEALQYAPLPPQLQQIDLQQLRKVTAGGKAVLSP